MDFFSHKLGPCGGICHNDTFLAYLGFVVSKLIMQQYTLNGIAYLSQHQFKARSSLQPHDDDDDELEFNDASTLLGH